MSAPLTEKELDDALRAAGGIGIADLKTMKAAIPRLVADLRAARAALLEVQTEVAMKLAHVCENMNPTRWGVTCSGCDDLEAFRKKMKAEVIRTRAALPPEAEP